MMEVAIEPQERLLIEAECRRVLLEFGRRRDRLDAAGAASLMAEDGVWQRDGKPLRGPGEVEQALSRTSDKLMMRHVFTNIVIDVRDSTHASGIAYYVSFGDRQTMASENGDVLPLDGPSRMGEYVTEFVKAPDGWKISYVTANRIFSK